VLRRLHRLVEASEVTDPQRLVFGQGRQIQMQAARKRERTFRTPST
jgi:hypothetical protein